MENFGKYNILGEPDIEEKSNFWRAAIGLQQVDGLTPSDYLIELANKNTNTVTGNDDTAFNDNDTDSKR
jgi:hypothetical protein